MSFSRGVDFVPKEVFFALSRGTARRAYVCEPVARRVLPCPLCHGRNVEAVEPEAGRGVNEITEALFDRLVKVQREPTAFSEGEQEAVVNDRQVQVGALTLTYDRLGLHRAK